MEPFSHPLLDFVEGELACAESTATTIYFSEPLADFLKSARASGYTPVFITRPDARWTFAARYYFEAFGARRLLRFPDAFVNADTGGESDSVSAACFAHPTPWKRPTLDAPDVLEAVVSVSAHHSAEIEVELGALAETLASSLAGCTVSVWGVHEPAPLAWGRKRFTEYARTQMPLARTFISGGGGAFQAVHVAARTRAGIMETLTAVMPVAGLGAPFAAAADAASTALSEVANAVSLPMSGSVCVIPGWRDRLAPAGPQLAPVPAAVLIGPRAVRALGADLDALAEQHSINLVGRKRLASVIASFGSGTGSPWQQAKELAESFGTAALARAAGVEDGSS